MVPHSSSSTRDRSNQIPSSEIQGNDKSKNGSRNMSSMTLAISHENATRMLEASRAFNLALNRLQIEERQKFEEEEKAEQQRPQHPPSSSLPNLETDESKQSQSNKRDGEDGQTNMIPIKKEEDQDNSSENKDKMRTNSSPNANVKTEEDNHVIGEPTSPTLVKPEQPEQEERAPSAESGTQVDSEFSSPRTSCLHASSLKNVKRCLKRKRPKPTPLPKLLIRAALESKNQLLTSYVRRMQSCQHLDRCKLDPEPINLSQEIETCLLLFLDMDKSSKLLTAFEVLGQSSKDSLMKGKETDNDEVMDFESRDPDLPSPTSISKPLDIVKDEEMARDSKETDETKVRAQSPPKELRKSNTNDSKSASEPVPQEECTDGINEENHEPKETSAPLPRLSHEKIMQLFRCFLSSISTCIHHQEQHTNSEHQTQYSNGEDGIKEPATKTAKENEYDSPSHINSTRKHASKGNISSEGNFTNTIISEYDSFSPKISSEKQFLNADTKTAAKDSTSTNDVKDWTLSNQTKREIQEIAIYATDQVKDYVLKKRSKSQEQQEETTTEAAKNVDLISFEVFGEWYNSGGFSLVPWLELLDLAKWDYAGRAAAAAVAAAVASQKHMARSSQQQIKQQQHFEKSMEPITEESASDMVVDSSSSYPPVQRNKRYDSHDQNNRNTATSSPGNLFFNSPKEQSVENTPSRTIIAFDFSGAGKSIKITEENLSMLKHLVHKTALSKSAPEKVASVLLRYSSRRRMPVSLSQRGDKQTEEVMVLHRKDFGRCIRELVPPESSKEFNRTDMENFSNYFTNFFTCFARSGNSLGLGLDYVNSKELAVGFSFLCAGNKSAKLASAFELLDDKNLGFLSQRKLTQYLRSYLTMLIGISLLVSSTATTAETRRMLLSNDRRDSRSSELFEAAENGASWTLDYFIRALQDKQRKKGSARNNAVTFEDFAEWYTQGGYTVAPWLEFLDLNKFLSLLNEDKGNMKCGKRKIESDSNAVSSFDEVFPPAPPSSSTSRSGTAISNVSSSEVLFTFPLANRQSLVVLREDASYVHTVVNQLGLQSMSPEEVWSAMYREFKSNPPPPLSWRSAKHHNSGMGKSMDVDQTSFVRVLEKIILPKVSSRKRNVSSSSSSKDTLNNFFQSFDLDQVDRVAANQLMGGLTLLCNGKKSMKLAFAFGLFDGRKDNNQGNISPSLIGKELFYFLRSFLIVTFSCCKQSLDLSAEAVGRYISDTANMVTDDVMKYQWRTRRSDRVDFDEFGEWYNEGGFETAPWLELLDLNKWVLLNQSNSDKSGKGDRIALPKAHRSNFDAGHVHTSPRQKLRDASNRQHFHAEERQPAVKIPDKVKEEPIAMEEEQPNDCPPAPPDDAIDPHADDIFDDDMGMEGMEDMDFMFQDSNESQDKENELNFSVNDPLTPLHQSDLNKSQQKQPDQVDDKILKNQVEQPNSSNEPNRPLNLDTTEQGKSLKFHLLTSDEKDGYMISISNRRVRLLKHLVTESELVSVDVGAACDQIVSEANGKMLTKDKFDAAMRSVVALSNNGGSRMTTDTQRLLSDLLTSIFVAFDVRGIGEVNAKELACGFTVLCGGRKSDKLEFAFELLDHDRNGLFTRKNMERYLQSFLTVLLSISSCTIGRDSREEILGTINGGYSVDDASTVSRVINWGASWATAQVFNSTPSKQKEVKGGIEYINFDNFADWYTKGGFTSIPWLELLDLRKWVLADS